MEQDSKLGYQNTEQIRGTLFVFFLRITDIWNRIPGTEAVVLSQGDTTAPWKGRASMDPTDRLCSLRSVHSCVWITGAFGTTAHRGTDLPAFYGLHLLHPYGRVILQTFSPGMLTGRSGWEGNVGLIKQPIRESRASLKHDTLFLDRYKQMG